MAKTYTILALIVIALVILLLAGCSQQTSSPSTGPVSQPADQKDVAEIALYPSDFPSGRWEGSVSDIRRYIDKDIRDLYSDELKVSDWDEAYGGIFTEQTDNVFDYGRVRQFIYQFPKEKSGLIKKFVQDEPPARSSSRFSKLYDSKKLSDPKIGDYSVAYRVMDEFSNTHFIIRFVRGNTLIVIETLNGDDYELLKELAHKVERKILPKKQGSQTAPVATAPIDAATTDKESSEVSSNYGLPKGWKLKSYTNITRTQMGTAFLTMGWQNGQVIIFLDPQETTGIVQIISFYASDKSSVQNISGVLITNRIAKVFLGVQDPSKTYENITGPEIGDESIAHKIVDKTKADSPIVGYQIEFRKGNTYVEIVIFGKSLDYELLKAVAVKAANKIESDNKQISTTTPVLKSPQQVDATPLTDVAKDLYHVNNGNLDCSSINSSPILTYYKSGNNLYYGYYIRLSTLNLSDYRFTSEQNKNESFATAQDGSELVLMGCNFGRELGQNTNHLYCREQSFHVEKISADGTVTSIGWIKIIPTFTINKSKNLSDTGGKNKFVDDAKIISQTCSINSVNVAPYQR